MPPPRENVSSNQESSIFAGRLHMTVSYVAGYRLPVVSNKRTGNFAAPRPEQYIKRFALSGTEHTVCMWTWLPDGRE